MQDWEILIKTRESEMRETEKSKMEEGEMRLLFRVCFGNSTWIWHQQKIIDIAYSKKQVISYFFFNFWIIHPHTLNLSIFRMWFMKILTLSVFYFNLKLTFIIYSLLILIWFLQYLFKSLVFKILHLLFFMFWDLILILFLRFKMSQFYH